MLNVFEKSVYKMNIYFILSKRIEIFRSSMTRWFFEGNFADFHLISVFPNGSLIQVR